jgi:hypothetical protein
MANTNHLRRKFLASTEKPLRLKKQARTRKILEMKKREAKEELKEYI